MINLFVILRLTMVLRNTAPADPLHAGKFLGVVLYLCPRYHLQDPNTSDPTDKCDDHKSGCPGNQSAVAKRERYTQKPSAYLHVDQPEEPDDNVDCFGANIFSTALVSAGTATMQQFLDKRRHLIDR